ncbi:MAG: segregation and condensation protein [Clostridia bacterium]|nr:segregation and condensation protein [Clostridia bacterium]
MPVSLEKRAALECLLFVAGEPVAAASLAAHLGLTEDEVRALVKELEEFYRQAGSGLTIVEVGGGYRLCTRPEYAPYVESFLEPEIPALSRAALETLAIIAYRQPVTRAEIEAIRGVKVDGVLATLQARKLIAEVGRRDAPGRPILYGTTREFLEYFGLKSLADLPPLPAEAAGEEGAGEGSLSQKFPAVGSGP